MSSTRDFLGPFRLIRLIRTSKVTQVWESVRDGEKDRCALKVLLAKHKDNRQEIDTLRYEAKVGKSLSHENVIRVHDFFDDYGQPFLQMELFNAKNLKQLLRENTEAVHHHIEAIIRKCAWGLQHMHESGWIHCDVKPDNFLVNAKGDVKLIDFSIAQAAKQGFRLFGGSKKKVVAGTRSYMAPEQIRGKKLDQRTDVYGLGCMMFEMVAGRTPFSGSNSDDLLKKHLSATPPSVQTLNKRVRKEFADLIDNMIAKKPEDRVHDMNSMLAQLDKIRVFKATQKKKATKKPQ